MQRSWIIKEAKKKNTWYDSISPNISVIIINIYGLQSFNKSQEFSDYKANKTKVNYRNNKSKCRGNIKSKNMLSPGETFIRNLQRKVQSTKIETIHHTNTK